ncbi:MAG TPA: HDOD domain-containing protein [Desulfobacterales bacterium]|nr:HDOD domain-containing protein [Desulfobacterales bacterium]
MTRMEEIMNIANHIPPFPKVALQVMKMLDNPEVKAKDLAQVIQYDSAITANLLKTCNAAYFGLTRKVSSLDDALVVVGQDILKDIIITSSSARFYKGGAGDGYQLEQGELWKHSVATAIMAKMMAAHFNEVNPNVAFTAGLLHDIGKRFLSSFVADEFAKIVKLAYESGGSFVEAEVEVLGMSHADLGAKIMKKWQFDQELIMAVKQHHDPDAIGKDQLTALVALANTQIMTMGIGVGADGLTSKIQGAGLKHYGITGRDLETYLAGLMLELEKAQEMMSLAA